MEREELLNDLYEWLDEECIPATMTADLPYDFADILRSKLDKIKACPALPPADGAEAFVKSKGLNLDYVKGIQLFLNPKYTVIDLMTEFAAQQQPKLDPKKVQWSGYGELGNISQKPPQPTAEGAEEILANHIDKESMDELSVNVWPDMLEAMQEYATLHAQRIAEKMVGERMEQYKAQFKDRPNPAEVNPYDSKGIKRIRNRKTH